MAQVHGVAGEWARVRGTVGGFWPVFLGMFAAGVAAGLIPLTRWAAAGLVVVLIFIAWSLHRGMRRLERFYKGARGEERIAAILQELPDGYHVFNDYVAGGTHVDHVVVGPTGVFVIETKFWNGRVTAEDNHILVNGQLPDRSPLAQAQHEATLVQKQIAQTGMKLPVTPILAFASDTFNAQPAEIGGVIVINSCVLKPTFTVARSIMSVAELNRLVQLMETNLS